MKKNLLTITRVLLFLCVFPITANAQNDQQKLKQLNNLLRSTLKTGKKTVSFVTPYMLDSVIIKYQNTISGSQVEAGKLIGTSISITDKGATSNIGIHRIGSSYLQLNVSGQGKDNFVNLLEKGKYGNTISAGLKWQFFLKSSGKFFPSQANLLHNRLILLETSNGTYQPALPSTVTTAYDTKLNYIYGQISKLSAGNNEFDTAKVNISNLNLAERKKVEEYILAADTLIKLNMLSANFLKKKNADRKAEAIALNAKWSNATTGKGPDQQRLLYYLGDSETLQLKANWNALKFHWLTVGFNENITPYKILDIENKADDYQRTNNDYFFSGSVAYNLLWAFQKKSQFRFFLSPTVNLSNARVYKDADKIILERILPYPISGDAISQKNMTAEVYNNVASRQFTASLEIPAIWYWNKHHAGFEVSPKLGVNDPKEDNVGLRIGFFIPAEIKDGSPIIIEPLFRLQKLFSSGNNVFWKDNAVIGFNLSISLPKGLSIK
jgi:hypothetical protein